MFAKYRTEFEEGKGPWSFLKQTSFIEKKEKKREKKKEKRKEKKREKEKEKGRERKREKRETSEKDEEESYGHSDDRNININKKAEGKINQLHSIKNTSNINIEKQTIPHSTTQTFPLSRNVIYPLISYLQTHDSQLVSYFRCDYHVLKEQERPPYIHADSVSSHVDSSSSSDEKELDAIFRHKSSLISDSIQVSLHHSKTYSDRLHIISHGIVSGIPAMWRKKVKTNAFKANYATHKAKRMFKESAAIWKKILREEKEKEKRKNELDELRLKKMEEEREKKRDKNRLMFVIEQAKWFGKQMKEDLYVVNTPLSKDDHNKYDDQSKEEEKEELDAEKEEGEEEKDSELISDSVVFGSLDIGNDETIDFNNSMNVRQIARLRAQKAHQRTQDRLIQWELHSNNNNTNKRGKKKGKLITDSSYTITVDSSSTSTSSS
ncbi:Chromatin-remodeling ATPase INO80, partial [Aduncisulcus paluster]